MTTDHHTEPALTASAQRTVGQGQALTAGEAWDHQAAYIAWSAEPGSPELLDAYVEARRQLNGSRRREFASAHDAPPRPGVESPSGPTVITPVIEWWQA